MSIPYTCLLLLYPLHSPLIPLHVYVYINLYKNTHIKIEILGREKASHSDSLSESLETVHKWTPDLLAIVLLEMVEVGASSFIAKAKAKPCVTWTELNCKRTAVISSATTSTGWHFGQASKHMLLDPGRHCFSSCSVLALCMHMCV